MRHGKGDKMRVVYFGDKVVNAVREYLRNRPKTGNPYLFPGRGDSHLSQAINRIFNEYSESITPHTLRHFFLQCLGEWIHHCRSGKPGGPLQCPHHTALHQPHPEKMKEKAKRL